MLEEDQEETRTNVFRGQTLEKQYSWNGSIVDGAVLVIDIFEPAPGFK